MKVIDGSCRWEVVDGSWGAKRREERGRGERNEKREKGTVACNFIFFLFCASVSYQIGFVTEAPTHAGRL